MKNFNHYSDNAFDFYKKVLDQKKSKEYKDYIRSLDNQTQKRFELYDALFKGKELESISISPYTEFEKSKLKQLYAYKSKCIQDLKKNSQRQKIIES